MSYGRRRRAWAARLIAGAGLFAASFAGLSAVVAGPAGAHTALKASSPKDGGKIAVAPSRLVMEFTEPILTVGYRVLVQGPDGHPYQAGAAQITDNRLTQPLSPLGPAGTYRVSFRIVAADGHPLTSGMRFTLTNPGPAAGGAKADAQADVQLAPIAQVSSNVNNAPGWAPWVGGTIAALLISGTVLFGRRVTRDLD
ncbi:MAG TPA: copper resistance CopC family protein [Streptosporangiaceae bacterium]